MSARNQSGKTGPLDRDAYFNAAFKILAASGFPELTVENLCAELGATKGSFYHHFVGMTEFVEALVGAWEARVSEIFTEIAALPPMEVLARSMDVLERWPVRADVALRTWAWADPVVAAAVRRQEAVWERLVRAWMEQFVPDPQRCRLLTHLLLAALAGMGQLQRPADIDLVRAVVMEILRSNVGIDLLPDATRRPHDAYL